MTKKDVVISRMDILEGDISIILSITRVALFGFFGEGFAMVIIVANYHNLTICLIHVVSIITTTLCSIYVWSLIY